jgi:hypothetical protein
VSPFEQPITVIAAIINPWNVSGARNPLNLRAMRLRPFMLHLDIMGFAARNARQHDLMHSPHRPDGVIGMIMAFAENDSQPSPEPAAS